MFINWQLLMKGKLIMGVCRTEQLLNRKQRRETSWGHSVSGEEQVGDAPNGTL